MAHLVGLLMSVSSDCSVDPLLGSIRFCNQLPLLRLRVYLTVVRLVNYTVISELNCLYVTWIYCTVLYFK